MPAHGTADVTVTANPATGPTGGQFGGRLTATARRRDACRPRRRLPGAGELRPDRPRDQPHRRPSTSLRQVGRHRDRRVVRPSVRRRRRRPGPAAQGPVRRQRLRHLRGPGERRAAVHVTAAVPAQRHASAPTPPSRWTRPRASRCARSSTGRTRQRSSASSAWCRPTRPVTGAASSAVGPADTQLFAVPTGRRVTDHIVQVLPAAPRWPPPGRAPIRPGTSTTWRSWKRGRIPADTAYRVRDRDLATVDARYHTQGARDGRACAPTSARFPSSATPAARAPVLRAHAAEPAHRVLLAPART